MPDDVSTDRGQPVARLELTSSVDAYLADLLARGNVRAPVAPRAPLPEPLVTAGEVSDLVIEQRK